MENGLKVEKVKKVLGNLTVEELDALPENDLKQRIVQASAAMKQVQDELDANEKYQELKEQVAAMVQGKKEVDKRQKAIVKYALHRIEEIGKDPGMNERLVRAKIQAELKKARDEVKELLGDDVEVTVERHGAK